MPEHFAWHFLASDCRLRYDNSIKVEVGQVLTVPPPLVMGRRGLHASYKPYDALRYAPGLMACFVELGGEIIEGGDKVCASERKCLYMFDASDLLNDFACECAEEEFHWHRTAIQPPDPRSILAVETKRRWMSGKVSGQELAEARFAAWSVALQRKDPVSRIAAFAASDPSSYRYALDEPAWLRRWRRLKELFTLQLT